MRIVHVSDGLAPRLGGIERHVEELALRQAQSGHDVAIVTAVAGPRDGGDGSLVRVHRPVGRLPSGRIHFSWSPRGARFVTAESWDVVHVHVSAWSPLGALAARRACAAGVPVAVTVHSLWTYLGGLIGASARLLGWHRWPIAWSAVSPTAAAQVAPIVGGRAVAVVPNAIDYGAWFPRARGEGADASRVVIASVMRLATRKRPRALVAMLARLREELPAGFGFEAVVIGDGPWRARMMNDIERLGLSDRVVLTGALDPEQVRDWLARADLYVAPARLESFGIAALEARAAGLPVVGYAGTGLSEFITSDVNGFLVDSDRAMVAALGRLIVDASLRRQMADRNVREVPALGWDRLLSACELLYADAQQLAAPKAHAVFADVASAGAVGP